MNLQIMIIASVIAVAVIGGGWAFITWQTKDYRDTIKQQQEQIANLNIEKVALQSSVTTLREQMQQQQIEAKKSVEEIINLRQSDQQSKARLNEVLQQLNNIENQQRIYSYLKGEKQSLVLRLMDQQTKCEMENFFNIDGKCIRGKYVKNNERLVPLKGE